MIEEGFDYESVEPSFDSEERLPKGTPQVPHKLSARLSKLDGNQVIYFVDKDFGIKNGLSSRMRFNILHPTRPNLCEITIPIERV
jgi:hypothetical protein